jgi:hypothetical protein
MTKKEINAIRRRLEFEYGEGRDITDDLAALLSEVDRITAERDRARNMLDGICSEFEGVVAHADWKAAGSKGMSVPFRGDFASAVQLPSLVGRMRWWANEMRKVIGGKVE